MQQVEQPVDVVGVGHVELVTKLCCEALRLEVGHQVLCPPVLRQLGELHVGRMPVGATLLVLGLLAEAADLVAQPGKRGIHMLRVVHQDVQDLDPLPEELVLLIVAGV